VPNTLVGLDASKGFILSIGMTLSLFFWLVSRLGDGKFVIPKDKLLLFAGIVPLVFLISSFFSYSFYSSLFGNGFEIGTFGSMLILFIVLFLSSIYFQSEKRLWYFLGTVFIGGLIIVVFELINIIFIGLNFALPSFLGLNADNLVGDWGNFALLMGIMVLLSLFTIELLKTRRLVKIIQYILLILGILFLVMVNISWIWLLVGLFAVIIFVYIFSIQRSGVKIIQDGGEKSKFPLTSLVVIFISLIFLIGSNLTSNFLSNYISINTSEIRPSIVTTSKIAYKSLLHNPLLGTGPNTFVIDWALWQPKEIAQTVFWNVDFTNGFSLLATFAVTTGLLGVISLLLLFIVYLARSIQSIRVALRDTLSNYFIITILMISLYSWITIIFFNPNITLLMLAFSSSGILVGILVSKNAIPAKEYSFLSDPRNNFLSILGILSLMIFAVFLTYVYVEKFTSVIYFSKGLSNQNTIESLAHSEKMFLKAIALDKNDAYYRSLSQIYVNQISILITDKTLSPDILKSNLQQLIFQAENSANLAIEQNKKQYLNYINLGDIYSSLVPLSVENSYERAVSAYNKALTLAPNNPSIPLARATLEFINKDNSEARKFIKQSLDLKRNYIDAIFLLVQIETNEGNLPEAIKQAEYAGEMAPNDETVFFRLGLLRYYNSNYNGAISAFEKAVILNNGYLNARFFLGQSYKKVGRTNDALTQFNILNKIIPDNQEIKNAINSISEPTSVTGEATDHTADSQLKPPLEEKNN
jgi:tetratricopeptide (TPR) repeat protein